VGTPSIGVLGMPIGIAAGGHAPDDLDDLVADTPPQHTVTRLSPRSASAADLRRTYRESTTLW
jgi:hydroxyacid-oxoacid transhydrogenase